MTRPIHSLVPLKQAPPSDLDTQTPVERPEAPTHSPKHPQSDTASRTSATGYALAEEGTRRHLVEFIDQEDLSDRPIDKEARISYVGEPYSS